MRPKLIVCGGSAYPRTVEADRFREIADEVGALLMCDMAHFSGLVAAGLHPEPGPALRLRHLDEPQDARRAARRASSSAARSTRRRSTARTSPGMQGGPLMHTIAAKAACFGIAMTDAFRDYQRAGARERRHARDGLIDGGYDVLTGGTDTHLVQLDLRAHRVDGARRAGAARGVQADREPQHGAVRRAAADGRVGRPARHAGGDDARLRRGRLREVARSSSTR